MYYKILVADNDTQDLNFIEKILFSAGYSAFESTTGNSAIRLARILQPDLIFLDWVLPDISGNEVCKILKINKRTKFIPLILMYDVRLDIINKVEGLMVLWYQWELYFHNEEDEDAIFEKMCDLDITKKSLLSSNIGFKVCCNYKTLH